MRVLGESEWSLYREVRLRALAESPSAFTATLADEADRDESFWRDRMTRSYRLLAERGQLPQGIVSLGVYEEEPSAAEVFGLYVVPEVRGTGVSWRLVEAAAALATQNGYGQLYYWVGTDNGRAIGFAKNSGSVQRLPPSITRLRPRAGRAGGCAGVVVGARHHISAEPDKREGSNPRGPRQLNRRAQPPS